MPLTRDQAICLRFTPYSESSQIVSLFTRTHGRIRAIAKGARRHTKAGKSRFDGGLDVLDSGDAVFVLAPERDLQPLTEWRLREGHLALRRDLRALNLALYAAELVEKLVEEHDPHPKLFDQVERLLSRLAEPESRESVALAFQLNLLRQVGLLPDFEVRPGEHVGFSPRTSRLVEADQLMSTPDAIAVAPEGLAAIRTLLRVPREGGSLPSISRDQADAANRLLIAHIQSQTGSRLRLARYVLENANREMGASAASD